MSFSWFLVGALAGAGGMYVAAKEKVWKPNPTEDWTVVLEDTDEPETVMATVSGPGALAWAKEQQSIGGSTWEGADGPDFAYALISNYDGLVDDLANEGYDIDDSMYSPPDPE